MQSVLAEAVSGLLVKNTDFFGEPLHGLFLAILIKMMISRYRGEKARNRPIGRFGPANGVCRGSSGKLGHFGKFDQNGQFAPLHTTVEQQIGHLVPDRGMQRGKLAILIILVKMGRLKMGLCMVFFEPKILGHFWPKNGAKKALCMRPSGAKWSGNFGEIFYPGHFGHMVDYGQKWSKWPI